MERKNSKFIRKTFSSLVSTKEMKYLDLLQQFFGPDPAPVYNANAAYALGTRSGIWMLNGIQEGTSLYNRVGRKIILHSLYIKLGWVGQGTAFYAQRDQLRIQVVYDKQTNGTAPLYTDIVKGYSNTGSSTSDLYDGLNPDNKFRFEILYDELLSIPAMTTNATSYEFILNMPTQDMGNQQGGNTGVIKKFIRLNKRITQYKSTTNPANVGDIATGGLFLIIWNEVNPNNNSSSPCVNWVMPGSVRLRFEDV